MSGLSNALARAHGHKMLGTDSPSASNGSGSPGGLSSALRKETVDDELLSTIHKLIATGRTNQQILMHVSIVGTGVSHEQIEACRALDADESPPTVRKTRTAMDAGAISPIREIDDRDRQGGGGTASPGSVEVEHSRDANRPTDSRSKVRPDQGYVAPSKTTVTAAAVARGRGPEAPQGPNCRMSPPSGSVTSEIAMDPLLQATAASAHAVVVPSARVDVVAALKAEDASMMPAARTQPRSSTASGPAKEAFDLSSGPNVVADSDVLKEMLELDSAERQVCESALLVRRGRQVSRRLLAAG